MSLSFKDSLKAAQVSQTEIEQSEYSIATMALDDVPICDDNANIMTLELGNEDIMIAAYSGDDGSWQQHTGYDWYNGVDGKAGSLGYDDDDISNIDDMKNISLNSKQLNITQEHKSQFIPFEMPRYYDGYDLTKATICINYRRKDGKTRAKKAVNVRYNNEKIQFGWLVEAHATEVVGKLEFEIVAFGADYIWKSRLVDKMNVLDSIPWDEELVSISSDDTWVSEIVTAVTEQIVGMEFNEQLASANDAANRAEISATNAASAATNAVTTVLSEYAKKSDLTSKIGDLKAENGDELTVEDYVKQEVGAIDVSEQLGNLGTNEDGTKKTVVQYVTEAVEAVDVSEQLGNLGTNENGTTKTVVQYVDDTVKNVSDKFGNLVDDKGNKLTVEDYVKQEVSTVDVSEQLGDLGLNENGTTKTVVQYVSEAVEAVDVSDELGNLVDSEGNKLTVEDYVKQEVGNVTVDLTGYAKENYVDNKVNPLVANINTNTNNIQSANVAISSINGILEGIDKSPKTKYRATYGNVELDDGSTAEYMFTLWKEENGVEAVQDRFQILGGGGASSSSVNMKISYVDGYPQSSVYSVNDEVLIKYNFEGIDSAGDYVGGIASWKIGSKVVLTEEISSGENYVDLTEYVVTGNNTVLLTVTHATGAIATKSWNIKVVDVRIESDFNYERTYIAGSTVEFTFIPYGSVDKLVHFVLDGEPIGTKESKSSAAGLSDSYTIPAQEHGSHLLEVYMTSDIADSNRIYADIIWYDSESDYPVIGCSTPKLTVMQHDTIEIAFTVFDPSTEIPTVIIEDNGEVIDTLNNLDKNTNSFPYVATTVGEHEVTLICGKTRKTITVVVSELDINITPVTTSLAFDFNPVGYSNNSENRLWSYESNVEGSTVAMTVSENFDWINGGYQTDSNGSYFCIKAGTTATINYKMFCATKDIGSQGGHYKLVFKTTNVQDASKPFFQCYKSDVGVIMQPHEANFYAGSGNQLYLAYSENDIIEFELNMGETITNSSDKMVIGYEDGVATKPLVYTSGAIFIQGIQDEDAEYITLGSTSCDLYIYRFKAYRKALTSKEVLNNFITDARSASEMLKRYNRNQIYNEAVNDLNYASGYNESFIEHFAKQCPDLRVILLSAPRFTKSKSDKVEGCTVRQIYTNGREVEDNWTVYNILHSGQGTSSNLYGASGRNLDLIMNKENSLGEYPWVEFADGTILSGKDLKINLTKTSVPINYFNIKLNIASSENENNAVLARRYNQFNPYKRPLVREDGYPYEVKDTMEFYNCVVFVQETDTNQDANGNYTAHVEFNDTNWHYYGLGNIGDSKKTDDTRMNDPDDINEFVVEIMDNNLPNSKFQSGTYDEKGYSITGANIATEWQTYKDDTYEMNNKYTVVTNTDKSKYLIDENLPILYELVDGEYVLTSDETIDSSKIYYEKNYPNAAYSGLYKDKYFYDIESGETKLESGWGISFECRYEHDDSNHDEHKRIWNEFYEFVIFSSDTEFYSNLSNYCVLDSVMYYYLFTLRYTMIDNRAKNSFWHYGKCEDGIYRWDLTMDYDNDTALGIDNFGKQVFRYGYEDFDYVDDDVEVDEDSTDEKGKAWVFNAATSTFYNRLRLLFSQELRNLYNKLDGEGAWNAEDLITQFDKAQSQFPEEVWRQDVIRKYIRPYTTSHINGKPDTTFLKEKMNGRKKYHRREFERNQAIYMASKYRTEDAKGNIIRLRAKDPTGNLAVPVNLDLTITPYMHMYVSVDYANGVVTKQYRAKPGVPVIIDYPLDNGDIIAIENAPYLQSIGDISALYTQEATLTTATRLKDVLLGNSTKGYSNSYLSDISMVKDGLIEVINIENIPSLDDELDVSTLRNLRTVLAKGSGIKGLILAKNCPVETLSLPSLSIFSAKNLVHLKNVDFDSLDNLDRLIIEDCSFSTIDNFVINDVIYESPNELTLLNNAPNLKRVRLTNIDWELPDTSVLERLYSASMGGYNANGNPTTSSYISGKVHVPVIRQQQLYDYQNAWSDLEITFDTMIEQFAVTFVNDDGTVLEVQYVDKGSNAIDPTTRIDNPLIPTKESSISHDYTFDKWDSVLTSVFSDRVITATYTESLRTYTIRYVSKGITMQESTGLYGENIPYTGLTPTYTLEESGYAYYLFNRWDKSGFIDGDKTVNAIFDKFEYTTTAFDGKELVDLTPVEIYAMNKLGLFESVITDKDPYSFVIGNDIDYDDIESELIISEKTAFTGSNYLDTGIALFDEDKDFVLAIDYEFLDGNSINSVLAQCFQSNGSNGFKLWYNSGVRFTWGTSYKNIASANKREMVIIRHQKGNNDLTIYNSNLDSDIISVEELTRTKTTTGTNTLVFGCARADDGIYENFAIGNINWCKVWYKDLGDAVCQNLAMWTHEKITLEACGFRKYYLSDNSSKRCSFSLLASHLLDRNKKWNNIDSGNTSGGFGSSTLNTSLNNRLYNAIPNQIRSLIKQVKVPYSLGNKSTEVETSDCYITIPSCIEVDSTMTNEPYINEGSAISYMTDNDSRKRAYNNGKVGSYWLRSPNASYANYVYQVNDSGKLYGFSTPSYDAGVLIEISF